MATLAGLLDLPTEILQSILMLLSTPSFVQASVSCKGLYELVGSSRNVVLHHLQHIPGIKIGLDDPTITTADLFLLFRQRASKHLYGANFNASCQELRSEHAIDVDASCIADLDKDYVTMSLVLKNTMTIRLYSSNCSLKETIPSPFAGGKCKVLQVVHRKSTIAVLYQWEAEEKQTTPPWMETALVKDHPHKKPNNLVIVTPPSSDSEDSLSDEDTEPVKEPPIRRFHLQLYDSLSADRPVTFAIDQHKDMVPRHFALSSRLLWAILWDKDDTTMPSDECEIVQYNAPRWPTFKDSACDSRVIWPTEFDPRSVGPSAADIDKGIITKKPKRISFFKEGRRLSMYSPGDVIPYKVLSVGSHRESRSPTNSIYFENRTVFQVDTSFFGMHESYWDIDEARQYCRISHLCLGLGDVWLGSSACKVLCILRSRSKTDSDDCAHIAELNRMNHVTAENCKAVARLWGWSNASSTLTGLETVAVSPRGTRIAIAQWNRVLIWSLDPKILCEDIVDFEGEDDSKKAKKRNISTANSVAEGFYERTKDKQMGWKIANLRPIVIDLEGAIARKMSWTIQPEVEEDVATEDDSSEGEAVPSQELVDQDDQSQIVNKVAEPHTAETEDTIAISEPLSVAADLPTPEVLEPAKISTTKLTEEEFPTQTTIKPKDEKVQSAATNSDHPETSPQRTLPDRVNPITCTQRPRSAIPAIETLTISPSTETSTVQDLPINTDTSVDASADIISTEEPSQVVIEASLSPLLQPVNEPKGKEKEIENACQNFSHTPKSSENYSGTSHTSKKTVHKKRSTEDELVILTDRGFQIWNFGVWSKGIREKQWLSDQ